MPAENKTVKEVVSLCWLGLFIGVLSVGAHLSRQGAWLWLLGEMSCVLTEPGNTANPGRILLGELKMLVCQKLRLSAMTCQAMFILTKQGQGKGWSWGCVHQ